MNRIVIVGKLPVGKTYLTRSGVRIAKDKGYKVAVLDTKEIGMSSQPNH